MRSFLTRRHLLRQAASGVAGLAVVRAAGATSTDPDPSASLKDIAAARGLLFGSEVVYEELANDLAYAALVVAQCAIMTPGLEAKWAATEPDDGAFDFAHLDWMVAFAEKHGIQLRGHNLLWNTYNPDWVKAAVILEGRGSDILKRHIATEVGRYRGRIRYWDVVNEATDPLYHPLDDGLIDGMWRRHIGPMVIDDAFKYAASADPAAVLFVNDDGLEGEGSDREEKRNTYLRLVETWLKRGVPIKGFGIESHLHPQRRVAEKSYRRFLAELGGMGLQLHITELDVVDHDLPADFAKRDQIAADYCKQVLDIALDEPAVKAVVTWGLSDRYTYMNDDVDVKRADGLKSRCLPYDSDLKPKAMWRAIADALRHAPVR